MLEKPCAKIICVVLFDAATCASMNARSSGPADVIMSFTYLQAAPAHNKVNLRGSATLIARCGWWVGRARWAVR